MHHKPRMFEFSWRFLTYKMRLLVINRGAGPKFRSALFSRIQPILIGHTFLVEIQPTF